MPRPSRHTRLAQQKRAREAVVSRKRTARSPAKSKSKSKSKKQRKPRVRGRSLKKRSSPSQMEDIKPRRRSGRSSAGRDRERVKKNLVIDQRKKEERQRRKSLKKENLQGVDELTAMFGNL
jgi:hypothetical protein